VAVLWQAGPLRLTAEGLRVGVSHTLRMMAIVVVSMTFVATTSPTALVLSLIQNANFPFRLGYGILVAYRFLPLWQTELGIVRAAHRIRGVGRRPGGRLGLKGCAATPCL
jgi:energy-coupling factor transport system permease protein